MLRWRPWSYSCASCGTKVRSWTTSGIGVGRAGDGAAGDERLLGVVGDQVAGGLAGVHVEAGDAPGVVVVEHQPRALLVGVVEGLAAVVGGVASTVMSGTFATLDALRPRRCSRRPA